MCGLLGYYLRTPDPRIAYAMAILSVEMDCRGGHSYGYFADGEVVKGLGEWHDSVPAGTFADKRVVMGHTRFATVGAKTVENAHPFEIGDIVGAHNGSVSNYKEMNEKYKRDFDVDSMHIVAHLDAGLSLKELIGHGAVSYIRRSDPLWRPHLARVSHGGDLEVCALFAKPGDHKLEDPIGYAWASTPKPLDDALSVAGFGFSKQYIRGEKLHWVGDEPDKPLELYYDADHEFALGARTYTYTSTPATIGPKPPVTHGESLADDAWIAKYMSNVPGLRSRMEQAGANLWDDKGFGKPTKKQKKHQKGTAKNLAYCYEYTPKGREATMMVSGKCWGCSTYGLVAFDPDMAEAICQACASVIDSLEADLIGGVKNVHKDDVRGYIAQLVEEEEMEEEELLSQQYGWRIPFESDPDMPSVTAMAVLPEGSE